MEYKLAIWCVIVVLLIGCTDNSSEPQHDPADSTLVYDDHERPDTLDLFSNDRFQNVLVERISDSTFRISGKGQVFEAAFSWVIEDGHNEIKTGHSMTDAGAPAWGNFSFEVTAAKRNTNSVLHLILFESSAKDGSRQHELPIMLY
jgi:hypothetical protein